MPYATVAELPAAVRRLPAAAQAVYRAAFNAAYSTYNGDEAKAHAVAWAAVKRGYEQVDGTWRKKAGAKMAAGTVTIRGIELARLGAWAATTGRVDLTAAEFTDMVAASLDPEVDHAPAKIGHIDPRYDGEPALGWLSNMRVERDTLVADLVDVPAGIADILPKAFRRRSVEIAYDVRTPGGRQYRAVITGLALLGVTPPAVKGLADVQALYEPRRAAAAAPLESSSTTSLLIAEAPAELDNARRAVAELAEATGASPAARAALDEAIAGLGGGAIAGIHHPPATPDNPGAHNAPPPGGQPMPVNEQRIRELMGLEEGADLESAVADLVAAGGTPPTGGTPAPSSTAPPAPAGATTPPAPPTPPAVPTPSPAPVATAPAVPAAVTPAPPAVEGATPAPAAPAAPAPAGELVGAGVVQLSAAQWADIQSLLGTVQTDRRTGAVDKALSEGRIHPSERDAYLAAMTTNEAGTTALLTSLQPNKFPVSALGTSDPAQAALAAGDEAEWDNFGKSIGVAGLGQTAATR